MKVFLYTFNVSYQLCRVSFSYLWVEVVSC